MGDSLTSRVLIDGSASGEVLATDTPLSLWGGLDATSATVIDRHHPLAGESISGRVLVMPGGRGSSASSAMLLETLVAGNGPAALLLGASDEILCAGVIVAEEMFGTSIPVLELDPATFSAALAATRASIGRGGRLRLDNRTEGPPSEHGNAA